MKQFTPFILFTVVIISAAAAFAGASTINQFRNNLDLVNIADPMVLKDGANYYLYATGKAVDAGFEVWQSTDMVNWRYKGYCFQKNAGTWSQYKFWAPECVKNGSIYYLYYSASHNSGDLSDPNKICVATSSSPTGPFIEARAPLFDDGYSDIDGHLFRDTNGLMYLYFARSIWWDGLVPVQNEIYVTLMTSYTTAGTVRSFCIKATQDWEKVSYAGGVRWNEGPWMLKRNGIYYLMYSANCYNDEQYGVGYATAPSPTGPWTKYSGNPVLAHNTPDGYRSGPGHHSVVTTADGQMWIVYHTHIRRATITNPCDDRQLNIDKLSFNSSGNIVVTATDVRNLQYYPNGGYVYSGSSDDFNNSILNAKWFVASENTSKWSLTSNPGYLVITAQNGDTYQEMHDYKNMFLQYAPAGDFFVYTSVKMTTTQKCEQAALYVWQNDDNYIRMAKGFVGTIGAQRFEAAQEVNGAFTSAFAGNTMGETVIIGIQKTGDVYKCLYWNNSAWIQVGSNMTLSLSPVKIGITAMSPGSGVAQKAYFNYVYINTRKTAPAVNVAGNTESAASAATQLIQCAPNPCTNHTVISYQLSVPGQVSVKVYNASGQLVKTLVNKSEPAGYHSVAWDGRDEHGSKVAAGVYLYRMSAGDYTKTNKMTVLR